MMSVSPRACWNVICAAGSILWAASAIAQIPEAPRIEDFRSDLDRAAVESARAQNIRSLAFQSYLWSLPAFLHFRQATEIKQARKLIAPNEEPFGGWVLLRNLATPTDSNNVLPNVDTLYGASYVLLDKQGPVVLSVPAIQGRYYSVALHDAYFNTFAVLGVSATKGKPADVLILPPDYQGPISRSFSRIIRAPTPVIALFQRIYVRGPDDVPAVRQLQDGIRLTPLAGWRSRANSFPHIATPEFDAVSPVRDTRDPLRFFQIANEYTCRNQPPAEFAALVDAFRLNGTGPCATLPKDGKLQAALEEAARDSRTYLNAMISSRPVRNGWRVPDPNTGKASLDYAGRAVVQLTQIASFWPSEAMYFTGSLDGVGAPLDGRSAYTLTFARGELPPIDPLGFWSLTMYDAATNLLVTNPINRYVLRPTATGVKANTDGSLTLHIANQKPVNAPEPNWLPAPAGRFIVVLRTYLPRKEVQDGAWFPPAIQKQ